MPSDVADMLRHQRFTSVLLLLAALQTSWPAEWTSFPGGRWRELPVPENGTTGFRVLNPGETGVDFNNRLTEAQAAANRTLYNGSGVAAGDIDGDGLPDLVFAGVSNQLEIYRNLGGLHFTNVTRAAGIAVTNFIGRGVVLADITGDGVLDLLASGSGSGVRCWRNDGHGNFTEMTAEAGTGSALASYTMALADADGNGTLDLYVANNRVEDIRDRGQVQLRSVRGRAVVPSALTNRLVIVSGQLLEYGEPDELYLNDGSGHFKAVPWNQGAFLDETGKPLAGPPLDWGLSATFRDLNGDGAPDLYVCNDFWTPDRIWLNDGHGHFRAAPPAAFRKTSSSSMGIDIADLDHDGAPELFVVDMLSRSPAWRKRQLEAQRPEVEMPGVIFNRPQVTRNTLFHGRGDETWAEIADYAGVPASEWAWQPVFLDVDLDGEPDLIITAGHAHDLQDRDAERAVQARQRNYSTIHDPAERQRVFTADLLTNNQIYPKLDIPVVAFRNSGGLRFEDVTANWGTAQAGVHHGIALADLDGDGDLDFVVNNLNGTAGIYVNQSAAPRIAIRLKGKAPNTAATGARVTLTGGNLPAQTQEVIAGGRYLSGSDALLMFASGSVASHSLEIRWRDGTLTELREIRPNRLYEVVQDEAAASPAPALSVRKTAALFADASDNLPSSHYETLYDDFLRQPLLPRRLSQLGPGIAWCDLNGDGWEDLVVGTGAGGRVTAFLNDQHGRFTPFNSPPFSQPQPRDTTTILPLARAGQRTAILAGAANYEDGFTNASCVISFEAGNPGPRPVVRDLPSSAGSLALADYSGDGVPDLFVGARVTAGRWPEAGGSSLFRQENGVWVKDATNSAVIDSPECVSAALWTDLNLDGRPELVLAGEFSAPRIFRNENGRLVAWNPPVQTGGVTRDLALLTGLWTSVNAGDFDGDGRIDLVLGNWGENDQIKASFEHPLTIYAGQFGSAALAIVQTVWDPARQALTPVRPLPDLAPSLPFLAGRFRTHREYSEATVDQVLGAERTQFRAYSAAMLRSLVLLNRGDHFESIELPAEAQWSPAFGICVADFDLDGAEDIFLAQNFFAMRPGVPRIDAGRGLLLKGDGNGHFAAVAGQESGLRVYGEQRGAAVADFDHDGRPDLVVTQNGAATRLFRNTGKNSGVRVVLRGPAGNPDGIGAKIRVRSAAGPGPVREIHAGAGYWSSDSAVQVLAAPNRANARLEVIWPNHKTSSAEIAAGTREIEIRAE